MSGALQYVVPGRDREGYTGICGQMRSLEKRLLGRERIEELVAAPAPREIIDHLRRWGWLSGEGEEGDGWENLLTAGQVSSDRRIAALDPLGAVTKLLMCRHDLYNLSALLRAKALSRPVDSIPLHPRGMHGLADLEAMVNRLDFSRYPAPLARHLSSAGERLLDGPPQSLYAVVFSALFLSLKEAAKKEGSRLFRDYMCHWADLENIKLQLKRMHFPDHDPEGGPFFPGGLLKIDLYGGAEDDGDLARRLSRTVYGPLVERSLVRDGSGGRRIRTSFVEREADDFLTAAILPARHVSFGPEPVWGYYLARETDAANVRTAVIALRSGLTREERAERMRKPYA